MTSAQHLHQTLARMGERPGPHRDALVALYNAPDGPGEEPEPAYWPERAWAR